MQNQTPFFLSRKSMQKILELRNHHITQLYVFLVSESTRDSVKWKGVEIKKGSAVVSYRFLANRLGNTEKIVRDGIKALESIDEIDINSIGHRFIVTIKNFKS